MAQSALERLRQFGRIETPAGNAFRPILQNEDGSFSTERTMTASFDEDGQEVFYNIPTIVSGRDVGEDEAVRLFREGKNPPVGRFSSLGEAEDAAQKRSDAIGVARGGEAKQLSALERLRQYQPPAIAAEPEVTSVLEEEEEEQGFLGNMFDRATAGAAQALGGAQQFVGETLGGAVEAGLRPFQDVRQIATGETLPNPLAEGLQDFGQMGAEVADIGREISRQAQEGVTPPSSIMDAIQNPGNAAEYYAGILAESSPMMLGAMATRSPAAGAALMGVGTGSQTYGAERAEGATPYEALAQGVVAGGMEAGFGQAPLESAFGGGSLGRRVLQTTAREPLSEAITGGGQAAAGAALRGEDVSNEELTRSIVDSLVVGAPMGAIEAALGSGGSRETPAILPPTGDPAVDAGIQAAAEMEAAAKGQTAPEPPPPPPAIKPRFRVNPDGTFSPISQTPPATPDVDDMDLPAQEADIAAIDEQLRTEQAKIANTEARNRVIKEITESKDKRTAANLQKMIGDGRIQFYGDQTTLPEGANSATDKGYFDGQRIYLNEAKLGEGEANSVALHEIKHYMDRLAEEGGQVVNRRSLRRFLGDKGNARVNSRINELATSGNRIANEALEDARNGATREDGSVDDVVLQDEVVPYFLQKVAAAREAKRPLGRALAVVKDIVSAAKAKISDFGLDLNLSENDILYLGKQLIGEAAKAQSGQTRTQGGQSVGAPPTGRAMLVGPRAENYKQYLDQGIVFKGALDELPRAEIDDSRTSIRPEGASAIRSKGSTFLGVVFNHPELYENYPEIKRTRIALFPPERLAADPTLQGEAHSDENTIYISPDLLNDEKELRRLLVHETQHIIQEKEGFIPGANVGEYMDAADAAKYAQAQTNLGAFLASSDRDTLNSISSKLRVPENDRPVSPQSIMNAALKQDRLMASFPPEEKALLREYQRLVREYLPLHKRREEAYAKYRKSGGEVEARTSEARIPLTQGERQETPYYETSRTMSGGVPVEEFVDNTKPESGSRLAEYRASQREKALSEKPKGRASKARPEQPERVKKRLGEAGIEQPLSRRAPVPTQARGVVSEGRSEKFVEEKTRTPATEGVVAKIRAAGDVALSAIAPSTRGRATDVNEIIERTLGETTESKVRAAQAVNALERSVKRVPKGQRDGAQRALVAASSQDAKVREAGIATLKREYPAVFAQYDSVRNQIKQWSLDAVVSIRDSGKQLTKKDVAIISKIMKNLDSYVTRAYKIDYKGPIADQRKKETLGAWSKGDRQSEGAMAFEEAKQFLASTLRIGQRGGMLKADGNLKEYTPQTLQQLEALHAEWVSRENFNTLPADATPEQQETYINTMLMDLENVRKSMTDAEYLQKLDDKALRLTKELVDTVNTGASKLVQYFRGARQDNTIVSARADVPEPIRKLWGEITEPTAALAITMMKQGEFIARQKMLRELYDIGYGRYFVDQKDARSDTFTEKLTGETFGPLEGMYATPSFKQAIESNVEPLNSWRKVVDSMVGGKADIAAQAAAGMSIGVLGKAGSLNKKATVVWNLSSWVNNFLGGPATPVMQGMIPGKSLGKATKAAKDLIGPSFNDRLSPEAQRVLKSNLQESGQVGEIQEAQRDAIRKLLLGDSATGKLGTAWKRIDDTMVDSYAMTDVVWKLDAFFSTVDWLKGYYKAKGVTRTDEQIDREAAERVKERSITFSRAAPLVKFSERLGVTSYAAYFYETYRTIGMSLIGAARDIIDGQREGGKAGKMKTNLGIRSALGAASALSYNRAILPAYQAAGGVALAAMTSLGAMAPFEEEEEEKLRVIREGLGDFWNGKELTFWRKTDDGKFIFIEPGRVNPNDPATTPVALLMSGDPEAALEAITGLFFGNQGIAAVLGVGAEVLFDKKAKKPSSAYSLQTEYNEMENALQNNLGISPDRTAQVTRIMEKYIPKIARTTLREMTEDTGLEGTDKVLAAMGQPFAIFDPKKDLRMSGFRDYSEPLDKAKEDFKTAIQTLNPSDEVIRDAYLRSLRMEHEAYTRMRQVVEAAKATGMSPAQITALLKKDKIGNTTQIASLVSGRFRPSFVSQTSIGNARKQELNEDPTKAAELETKYRRIDRIIRESNKEFLEENN